MGGCRVLPASRVRRQVRRSARAERHLHCPQVQTWIGCGVCRRATGPVARLRSLAAAAASHSCVTDKKGLLHVGAQYNRAWKVLAAPERVVA